MSQYFREEAEKRRNLQPPKLVSRLPLVTVIEQYLPQDFRVYALDNVDLNTLVDYETSRPWIEALGKPLSDVGIEMTAYLDQRVMFLKSGSTTLEQVLGRDVPDDYTVYSDERVALETPIKVDRSKPWFEGLALALDAIGIVMSTNVDKRLVVIKPKAGARIIRTKSAPPEHGVRVASP